MDWIISINLLNENDDILISKVINDSIHKFSSIPISKGLRDIERDNLDLDWKKLQIVVERN